MPKLAFTPSTQINTHTYLFLMFPRHAITNVCRLRCYGNKVKFLEIGSARPANLTNAVARMRWHQWCLFFFFFSSFNSAAWVPRTLLRTKARIKRNKFATQQCNTMFKEAGRWGIACYGKQNRHSKKTHFSVLLQSNKNEQERLQDEECQARAGATVAPQGQWCLLSAVHSSGTTPAKSRCNVTGLARQFWPLPHRRRLPQELSSAPPVLTRRRADVLQQAAATNLKSLSVFFVS